LKIPINPNLPANFEDCPNDLRPASHRRWWYRPFIVTYTAERMGIEPGTDAERAWLKAWPEGTRYEVRCLDGGAWDRSTRVGAFATLAEAEACALGVAL
jgi:hypothetical protein